MGVFLDASFFEVKLTTKLRAFQSTVFDAFRIEQTFAYGERVLDGSQTF